MTLFLISVGTALLIHGVRRLAFGEFSNAFERRQPHETLLIFSGVVGSGLGAAIAGLNYDFDIAHISPAHIVAIATALWFSLLLAMAAVDWCFHLLHRSLSYVLAVLSYFPYRAIHGHYDWQDAVLGGLAGILLLEFIDRFYRLRHRRIGLGGGDSRFAGAIGLAIGLSLPGIAVVLLLAPLITLVVSLFNRDESEIGSPDRPAAPFGIGLALGGVAVACWQVWG